MTVLQRIQQRGMPLSAGGWGGWMSDPAAIPPPSVYNQAVAGVIVNERTILSVMTMFSCLRVLGDAASQLSVNVHRQVGSTRRFDDPKANAPDVIVDPCANPVDREQKDFNLVASWCLNGNSYTHIIDRDKAGNPRQIEVLNPSQIRVNMVKGNIIYRMGDEYGPIIPTKDIVHVPWVSLAGGLVGLNPVEVGAVGFGEVIAANEYASRFFAQGIHPSGLLSVEKPVRENDAKRIGDQLMTKHGGLAQSHTPIILDSKAKWMQIAVNPETAQLLEARAFSREEICGFYGVPPHLVGDTSSAEIYGTGLQEMVMGFAMFALNGYTRRLDRMDTKLLPAGYYVRRDITELFRNTNDEAMGQFVSALRMNAVATPNEVRKMVRLPASDEDGANSLWGPINSAHSDFMVEGGGALAATPGDANQGAGAVSGTPQPGKPGGTGTPIPSPSAPPPQQTGPSRSRLPLEQSSERLGFEEFQQQQGHGYHGYFEPGKGPSPQTAPDGGGGNLQTDDTAPPVIPTGRPVDAAGWTAALQIGQQTGGFTVNVADGTSPTTGFQVGGAKQELLLPADPKAAGKLMETYVHENPDIKYMGGWFDSENNRFVVEQSDNVPDPVQAVYLGMSRNQISIWDNVKGTQDPSTGEVITYGTGEYGAANPNFHAPKLGALYHSGNKPTGYQFSGKSIVGKTIQTDPNVTSMSGLSEGQQGKIRTLGKKNGLDPELVDNRYLANADSATPQQIADGLAAYSIYNAEAENIAHETGVTTEQAAGIIASLSRQTPLGSNIAGAHLLAKIVKEDPVVNLPDDVIEAGKNARSAAGTDISFQVLPDTKLSQQGDIENQSRILLRMISQSNANPNGPRVDPRYGMNKGNAKNPNGVPSQIQLCSGTSGIGAAIQMARGASPDAMVGGHKQRSFYNNIVDPYGSDDVTIDGFMVGIGMGFSKDKAYKSANEKIARSLMDTGAATAENQAGSYPVFADGVRDARDQYSAEHGNIPLTSSQMQAIIWIASGGGASTGVAPTSTPVARPNQLPPNTPLTEDQQKAAAGSQAMSLGIPSKSETAEAQRDASFTATVLRPEMSKDDLDLALHEQGAEGYPWDAPEDAIIGVKTADGKAVIVMQDSQLIDMRDSQLKQFVPTHKDLVTLASTAADLYDSDHLGLKNPPTVLVLGPGAVMMENPDMKPEDLQGCVAWTSAADPTRIWVSGVALKTPEDPVGAIGWHMPIKDAKGNTKEQYTITHEYGHLTEFAHELYPSTPHTFEAAKAYMGGPSKVKKAWTKAKTIDSPADGLSSYGLSNPHEGYAESFAEWKMSGGQTPNKTAQSYAKIFKWASITPTELPEGSSEPLHSWASELTPTKDKQQSNAAWKPLSDAEHAALPEDHEHYMVEAKQNAGFHGAQRPITTTHGPFHSKPEVDQALSEHPGWTQPKLKYYPPGTLKHD